MAPDLSLIHLICLKNVLIGKLPMWFRFTVLSLVLVAAAMVAACGSNSPEADGDQSDGNDAQGGQPSPGSDFDGIRLHKVSIFDPAANGEAFTFLVPTGWDWSGDVVWRHDLSTLASATFSASDPNNARAVEVFPTVPFTWQEGGVPFFPVGTVYLGNQVQPPIFEPSQFVSQMVLPTFRSQFNPQIIEWEELPDVSAEVARNVQEEGFNKVVRSGRVRVEYFLGETLVHEDFFVSLVFTQSPLTPITLWSPERLYSFRAEAGQLDDASSLMHTVVFSTQVNRRWLNEYLQVVDLWHRGQLQAIQSAGELSRYIAQVNDEILDITNETFERQQVVQDRLSREWSETIRGVDSYQDPFLEDSIELPSGFDDVWASANGEYILSNNALFDPNIGSNIDWERLRPLP